MRKIGFIVTLMLVLGICMYSFTACDDKNDDIYGSFSDIYVKHASTMAYTGSEKLFSLPKNYSLYYTGKSSKDYAACYSSTMEGFLVQTSVDGTTCYGMYNYDGTVKIPAEYTSFSIAFGYMSCQKIDGSFAFFNKSGEKLFYTALDGKSIKLFAKDGNEIANYGALGSSLSASSLFTAISRDYIAVRAQKGYCYLYTADCQLLSYRYKVKGEYLTSDSIMGLTTDLRMFDNYLYLSSTSNKITTISIYTVDTASGTYFRNINGTHTASSSNETINMIYLGDGNFYCSAITSQSTVPEEYDFVNLGGSYCTGSFGMYSAKSDTEKELSDDIILSSVINSYYVEDASDNVDIDEYFNKGYSYVSVAMVKAKDKTTKLDQLVIDSNFNVLISMNGELNDIFMFEDDSLTDMRDILLKYTADIGCANNVTGDLRIYDANGNIALLKNDSNYSDIIYNNGIIVAAETIGNETYYVAFKIDGKEIIPFSRKFTSLTAFIGGRALAEYYNTSGEKCVCIVDTDGVTYAAETICTDSDGNSYSASIYSVGSGANKKYFYKAGAYVVKDARNSKYALYSYDGVKLVGFTGDNIVIVKYGFDELYFYTITDSIYSVYKII